MVKKLETKRLIFSPIDFDQELDYYYKIINKDEVIAEFNGFLHSLMSRNQTLEGIKNWEETGYTFTIFRKDTKEPIGNISLFKMDPINKDAHLGIFISGEENRNQGFGREAIEKILDYAFEVLHIHCLRLFVKENNLRAIKLYKSLGFIERGYHEDIREKEGKRKLLYFDMLEGEYHA